MTHNMIHTNNIHRHTQYTRTHASIHTDTDTHTTLYNTTHTIHAHTIHI